ncbi:hypothetical protein GLYMA_16G128080v4 [Glycine max]|nr:hypothetical protein GLYMA_16G128080v4 [Glycine max]
MSKCMLIYLLYALFFLLPSAALVSFIYDEAEDNFMLSLSFICDVLLVYI